MATNPKSKISPQTASKDLKKDPPKGIVSAVIGRAESKLGPVGPGKHEEVRREALKEWAEKKKGLNVSKGKK